MLYIQANIGRNVQDSAMSESDWNLYIDRVRLDIETNAVAYDAGVEVHKGIGVYNGIVEESAHLSLLVDSVSVSLLKRDLAESAAVYGQETVALIVTQSELVEAWND